MNISENLIWLSIAMLVVALIISTATRSSMNPGLTFEEWLEKHGKESQIASAETGADRKADFNLNDWYEEKYLEYIREGTRP